MNSEYNRLNNKTFKFNKINVSEFSFRLLFILFWVDITLVPFAEEIISRIPYLSIFSDYTIPFLRLILFIVAIPYIIKKIKPKDLIFFISFLCFIIFFCFKNIGYLDNLNEALLDFLFNIFPVYFLGICYSHKINGKDIIYVSILGVIFVFLYQIYFISSGRILANDNMYMAYGVLPSVLCVTGVAVKTKKIINIFLMVLGFFLLLMLGTRGAIIVFLVFLILAIVYDLKNKNNNKIKFVFLFASLVLVVIYVSSDIFLTHIHNLSTILNNVGIRTRIFDYLIEGEITTSRGREIIYRKAIESINAKPLVGYGFLGDRILLNNYAHNLFLELMIHFGVIFGFIISAFFIFFPIAAIIKIKDNDYKLFIIMIFCYVFIKLMLSNTYVQEPYLFLLIGLSTNVLIERKYEEKDKKNFNTY